jgi:hypothetical protein
MNGQESLKNATVEEVYEVARKYIKSGASAQEVQSLLAGRGVNPQAAASVVKNVIQMRSESKGPGGAGVKHMMVGGLVCLVGTAATVMSYMAASSGGTYVVAWGAIVFGAIQFCYGLVDYMAR